jgi:methionine synthase / methylenetetrahydrofolate reductase(NADPH)
MKNELRVSVPDGIIERMTRAPNADAARAEGILIAREMLHQVRGLVQGAQVAAPLGRYSSALQVLDGMGGSEKALSTQQSAVSQGQS